MKKIKPLLYLIIGILFGISISLVNASVQVKAEVPKLEAYQSNENTYCLIIR